MSMVRTLEAIFIATGESVAVLALADKLDGLVVQRLAIGDPSPADNTSVDTNSVIVKLALPVDDSDAALESVQSWLNKHFSVLNSVSCRKSIEFQIYLDSNIGSRTLTLPFTIVRACSELGLDIATQAIRVLARTELAELRSRSK